MLNFLCIHNFRLETHKRLSQKGQCLSIFPPITALRAVRQCVRCYLPGLVRRLRRLRRVLGCLSLRGKHLYQLRTPKGSGQAPASVCERME
nr:MAG TPA: hypothetical protein [Caudoviricetes sp.]